MWTCFVILTLLVGTTLTTSCGTSAPAVQKQSQQAVTIQGNQKPFEQPIDPAPGQDDSDFCDPDAFKLGMKIIKCEPIEPEVCGTKQGFFFLEDQSRCTEFL